MNKALPKCRQERSIVVMRETFFARHCCALKGTDGGCPAPDPANIPSNHFQSPRVAICKSYAFEESRRCASSESFVVFGGMTHFLFFGEPCAGRRPCEEGRLTKHFHTPPSETQFPWLMLLGVPFNKRGRSMPRNLGGPGSGRQRYPGPPPPASTRAGWRPPLRGARALALQSAIQYPLPAPALPNAFLGALRRAAAMALEGRPAPCRAAEAFGADVG